MNNVKQIYDLLGTISKLSPEKRFEILKKAGYIPSEAQFEEWAVEEYDINNVEDYEKLFEKKDDESKRENIKKENINPCLCGGRGEIKTKRECFGHGDFSEKTYVECDTCYVRIGDIYDREIPKDEIVPKAIELWNRHNPRIKEISFSWPFGIEEELRIRDQRLRSSTVDSKKRENNLWEIIFHSDALFVTITLLLSCFVFVYGIYMIDLYYFK